MRTSCAGCIRLCARYSLYGRLASMNFVGQLLGSGIPAAAELDLTIAAYLAWEVTSIDHPNGYSSLRSEDSYLVSVRAWSIDVRSDAIDYKDGLYNVGLIPTHIYSMLPAQLAPTVEYQLAGGYNRRGRTYCVGLSTAATYGAGNANEINAIYRLTLQSVFAQLVDDMYDSANVQLGHLVTRTAGVKLVDGIFIPYAAIRPTPATMNTQRRRVAHGRG